MIKNYKTNFIVIIGVFSFLFFAKMILMPVKGVNSLQIADHYSIALNFLENGFNFFKPETYTLNVEFPATKSLSEEKFAYVAESSQGITAIDFPISHFCTAILFKIFNNQTFIISRILALLISLLGLFYLYKGSLTLTKSYKASYLLIISLISTPLFLFFSSSGLPGVYAFSILQIAFYHYSQFYKHQNYRYFNYFVFFITLSALVRFPFIIYLLGLFFTTIFFILINYKTKYLKQLYPTIIGLMIVVGYFLYNKYYLSYHFGSIMLSSPQPADNFFIFWFYLKETLLHQIFRYATALHYLLIFLMIKVGFQKIKDSKLSLFFEYDILYLSMTTIGVLLYAILMFKQYMVHGYYMFDTFLPILIFWSIVLYPFFPKKAKQIFEKKKNILILFVVLIAMSKLHMYWGYDRIVNHPDSRYETSIQNFENTEALFDHLKIKKKDRILFLDEYTNMIFNAYKRKSYLLSKPTFSSIQKAMSLDYEYIITQNFSFEDKILSNYPNFNQETSVFYKNDQITIYQKK